jgi:hypothetical protein
MAADVDDGPRFGPGRHERLVDEADNLIAAITQSHGDSPFVICDIGPLPRPLKD